MFIRYLRCVRGAVVLCVLTGTIIISGFGSICILADEGHDPLKIILSMRDRYENIENYTAVMVKGEPALNKKKPPEQIYVKFKKPFSVYLKWFDAPCKDREVLYIADQNNDCIFVRPEGLFGFLIRCLKLPSTFKRKDSRHTLKDFGIGNLIEDIIDVTLDAKRNNVLDLRYKGIVTRNGREVFHLERFLPKEDYMFPRVIFYIDTKTYLPLEVYAYNKKGKLSEYCLFLDLVLNPQLSEEEFSVDNDEYGFSYL
ncbi:MAG: DUF1571 domain-containing protein [Candidatus Ancaeobacter aquaticus]|nr:DUF1571 domain-containing protein [Candidatus Ancaeobacter aquaticus]